MRVLLDTHLLVWAAGGSERLPRDVRNLIVDDETTPAFSTASIWEVAIKFSQRRPDFTVSPQTLRAGLLAVGYEELKIEGEHAAAVADLPWVHRDPFDRLLVAQAMVEGIDLLTVDATLAGYPAPIRVF